MKHDITKNVRTFLESFDIVNTSDNKEVVMDSILDTKLRIQGALSDNIIDVTWLATYGPRKGGFALSDLSKLNDSYWESIRQFHIKDGNQIQITDEFKIQWFNKKLKQRGDSYNIWLNYLTSDDANYIPDYLHSWILHGISKIGRYDADKQKIVKRKAHTMDAFVTLYPDLLAFCVSAFNTRVENPNHSFDNDELNQMFKQNKYPSFNTLYQYYLLKKIESQGLEEEILLETNGRWEEYSDVSQAQELSRILTLYPALEWCTKSEYTARKQLEEGSLFIFFSNVPSDYTNKDWVKYGYPRLCIRTINTNSSIKITETRGCLSGQEIDEFIISTDKLDSKLKEFGPQGEEYIEIKSRLDSFNTVYLKFIKQHELSHDDMFFVLGCHANFFGYSDDARVLELKKIIKEKLLHSKDFSFCNLKGINLEDANLTNCNFSNCNLSRANLKNTNLTGANLTSANFTAARFTGSIFSKTNLNQAIMITADLDKCTIINSNMTNVNLSRAVLFGSNFEDVLLCDSNLSNSFSHNVHFNCVDLSGADLTQAYLRNVKYYLVTYPSDNYKLLNGILVGPGLRLVGSNFNGLDLCKFDLSGVDFGEADLSDVDFTNANLIDTNFTNTNLRGSNLEYVEITYHQLSSSIIDSTTKLPQGYIYNATTSKVEHINFFKHLFFKVSKYVKKLRVK